MAYDPRMTEQPDYCEALVREADKDRFLATLFAPAARRPDLFALYAFDLETAAVPHRVRDLMAGEVRYQWWHDAIAGSAPAGYPVADALLSAMERSGLSGDLVLSVIEARRRALFSADVMTEADFEVMASETAGAIFQGAAEILGGRAGEAVKLACHHAGVASAAAQADAARLSFDRSVAAQRHLAAAKVLVAELPEAVLPAFLPLALVRPGLERPALPQWRRQWILWRASKDLAARL